MTLENISSDPATGYRKCRACLDGRNRSYKEQLLRKETASAAQ